MHSHLPPFSDLFPVLPLFPQYSPLVEHVLALRPACIIYVCRRAPETLLCHPMCQSASCRCLVLRSPRTVAERFEHQGRGSLHVHLAVFLDFETLSEHGALEVQQIRVNLCLFELQN